MSGRMRRPCTDHSLDERTFAGPSAITMHVGLHGRAAATPPFALADWDRGARTRAFVALQRTAGNAALQHSVSQGVQRQPASDPLEPYRIEGGKYSVQEKRHAAEHPKGLILTTSVIGRLERSLSGRAPSPISVSKEMTRFEAGKLGAFVTEYNDFTHYFGEVLYAIGRLRDLLSSGAPETPEQLTVAQKRALRPSDNTKETEAKKSSYRAWRKEQAKYATSTHGLSRGLVFDVARTAGELDRARHQFWQKNGNLERSIAAGKRLERPKYEALELKLRDAMTVARGGPLGIFVFTVDKVLDAKRKRADYDEKMQKFADAMQGVSSAVRDDFEALKDTEGQYWDTLISHQVAVLDRDNARIESRQMAGLFGQATESRGETRNPVLAEVRMPALVADAWHALAAIGPPAREKFLKALARRGVVERASKRHHQWMNDPLRLEDISRIRDAWKIVLSWEPILTGDDVEEWQAVNKLWEEIFSKFNV